MRIHTRKFSQIRVPKVGPKPPSPVLNISQKMGIATHGALNVATTLAFALVMVGAVGFKGLVDFDLRWPLTIVLFFLSLFSMPWSGVGVRGWLATGTMAIICLLNRDQDNLAKYLYYTLALFVFYSLSGSAIKLNVAVRRVILWVTLALLVFQFVKYRSHFPGRFVNGGLDPNFSGLIMLVFATVCLRYRFIPGLALCAVATLGLLSRNYFLALMVLGLMLSFFRRVGRFLSQPALLYLIVWIAFVPYNIWRVNQPPPEVGYTEERSRLIKAWNDRSNYMRFSANVFAFDMLREKPEHLVRGAVPEAVYFEYMISNTGVEIHNSALQLAVLYGVVFAVVYALGVCDCFSRFRRGGVIYVYGFLIYSLFLHNSLSPLLLLAVVICASDPTEEDWSYV